MGKPAGGVRPIALMPMLHRLWTKVRRDEIRQWDLAHTGPWDAAIRGSSALKAAIMGAMFDEVNTLNGKAIGTVLWDMEHFYDNIDILKLSAKAMDVEYLIMVFTLGIQMHIAMHILTSLAMESLPGACKAIIWQGSCCSQ